MTLSLKQKNVNQIMLYKRNFSLLEAVVLLQIYLNSKDRNIKLSVVSREGSTILRTIAINNGYEIDEKFRSVSGIQGRLWKIASMYEGGDDSNATGPPIFREAIQLYKCEREKYYAILAEAQNLLRRKNIWLCASSDYLMEQTEMENMELADKKMSNEDAFFKWLSIVAPEKTTNQIIDNYKIINTLLLQKHALAEPLFKIHDAQQVEKVLAQTKQIFSDKKMRVNANLLLSFYRDYLKQNNEAAKKELATKSAENAVPDNWIFYDFSNETEFIKTVPVQCTLSGDVIEGKTWAQILAAIANHEIKRENPSMTTLYTEALPGGRADSPFLMKHKISGLACRQLENGYWININYSLPYMMRQIKALCLFCGYSKEQVVLYGLSKNIPEEAKDNTADKYDKTVMNQVIEAIYHSYGKGLRFEETVILLLEQDISAKIDEPMQIALKNLMFRRKDEVYFMPNMVCNTAQAQLLDSAVLMEKLSKFGCIDVEVLYSQYNCLGDTTCLRDEGDFEDYLTFLLPNAIRFANALKTRIIRRTGVSVAESLNVAAGKVVSTIKGNGYITLDDLQLEYPLFSGEFLRRLLEKYTDEVVPTTINEFYCFQTVEFLGLDEKFSALLKECLNELDRLSLRPSLEVIHTMLSIKLGYNLRDEYNIPDDKTFRHIISVYYDGDKPREWKSGIFVEVTSENV